MSANDIWAQMMAGRNNGTGQGGISPPVNGEGSKAGPVGGATRPTMGGGIPPPTQNNATNAQETEDEEEDDDEDDDEGPGDMGSARASTTISAAQSMATWGRSRRVGPLRTIPSPRPGLTVHSTADRSHVIIASTANPALGMAFHGPFIDTRSWWRRFFRPIPERNEIGPVDIKSAAEEVLDMIYDRRPLGLPRKLPTYYRQVWHG